MGEFEMITGGERIMACISGGKDSLIMLHVLKYMQSRSPVPFEVIPAVFDPGFPEFGLDRLQAYCREQNWDLHVTSLDIGSIIREKGVKSPCMMCARLRRGLLYKLAESLQCTHLALGQHLDDIETSFLMSLARGQGLTTMAPNVPSEAADVRIIRPLAFVPESLIIQAAEQFDFPRSGKCSYAAMLDSDGDRAYFKNLLNTLEERIPHVRSNILRSLGNVQTDYLMDNRLIRK